MIRTNNQNRADRRIIAELNGVWEIEPGEMNSPPSKFMHRVEVPSLVDCATPSYDWRGHDFHWYRRTFLAEQNQKGRPAFLKIEQSMFGTAVRVNGSLAGESISCYTSQEYRIDEFLKYGSENEILIRVGQRATLPPESAVGKDQERISFIPGIWGDVKLVHTGHVRVKLVQMLPRIDESRVDVNVWLENMNIAPIDIFLSAKVREKSSGEPASGVIHDRVTVEPMSEAEVTIRISMPHVNLWSPDTPFLYVFTATLTGGDGAFIDEMDVTFGMREFKIDGPDFLLNGKKIYLKGSNIAFHRFLSDEDRRLLPWNEEWIRKLLVEIPKGHNFNFFRAHLGHMYNRWYDIADEGGIMLQDEWQFWGATGTKEQISREFTEWLKDNWNHPSIVIWDPLNESSDAVVQNEIIPEMKKLDPTRPWESYDFFEDHPYIYSLGPVLVNRKFGYTRSLDEIENSTYPSQVNEYLWWWLDKNFRPSGLTKKVVSRWLGEDYSKDELIEQQSFLASELTELFRRMRVRCIQPFVYLSSNEGPTSHWFKGDISGLDPKPVLVSMKNTFEPFGVSIELWDRHFVEGENRSVSVLILNDYPFASEGKLKIGIVDSGGEWVTTTIASIRVEESGQSKQNFSIIFPSKAGDYHITAELTDTRTGRVAMSNKVVHVYPRGTDRESSASTSVSLPGGGGEVCEFLISRGVRVSQQAGQIDQDTNGLFVVGNEISAAEFENASEEIFSWVEKGGRLVLLQPEDGVKDKTEFTLPGKLRLIVEPRKDLNEGGYDSHIIPSDLSHIIWKGIRKEDLRIFNGGYGGEIVPQCDLKIIGQHEVLARSGLGLARPVIVSAEVEKGLVIISSVEVLGRLVWRDTCNDSLFALRPDPVAQQLILNLVEFCSTSRCQTLTRRCGCR